MLQKISDRALGGGSRQARIFHNRGLAHLHAKLVAMIGEANHWNVDSSGGIGEPRPSAAIHDSIEELCESPGHAPIVAYRDGNDWLVGLHVDVMIMLLLGHYLAAYTTGCIAQRDVRKQHVLLGATGCRADKVS
ncbi:MAG TPA: hypothetical protein VH370_26740 [Humisphaera sp.]|nr:hypothetical protein [Humisphaera sp.]